MEVYTRTGYQYKKFLSYDFECAVEGSVKEHRPVFASVYFEGDLLCHFQKIFFADDALCFDPSLEGVPSEQPGEHCSYYPPGCPVWIPQPHPGHNWKGLILGPHDSVAAANHHIETISSGATPLKGFNNSFAFEPNNFADKSYLLQHYPLKQSSPMFKKQSSAVGKLLRYLLRPRFAGYCATAHNGGTYDVKMIYQQLAKWCIPFKVLMRDGCILSLTVKGPLNILFLDSLQYFSCSLANMAISHQLPLSKGYFPYRALDNSDLYGQLEEISFASVRHLYDCQINESPKQREARNKWLEEQIAANRSFSLRRELVWYGEMDSKILILALCNLIKRCFEQQLEMLQRKGPPPEWKSIKKESQKN